MISFSDHTSFKVESKVSIVPGMNFQTWEQLEHYFDQYALQEGFSYKKTRLEYYMSQTEMKDFTKEDKSEQIKRRTYERSYSQTHTSKKVVQLNNQRNKSIQQINCPWHVNVTKLKDQSVMQISSVNLDHNHEMNPVIHEMAPKF